MLVNYFCGVDDRLKSLTRQAQVADPAGSSHWPDRLKALAGRLKSLARQAKALSQQAQVASLIDSSRWPGRLKSPAPQS